ncbi:NAD(P)/FAD-dependent oxidoreductase [Actinomadura sp. SCN-SB]|uniref:NAD(P)/FAD-dependent oxidoreductase n=1 Tax=Actinomadura sp. SCN-SB TaxID=3373092 RepID=UPI0037538AC9
MTAKVAVVGGGYGGSAVAKALDEEADVVLIEPRDAFVHNVAALRALVDPSWTDEIFFPYDGLLKRGTVVRDRAARADESGVTLASGERIEADYLVLATGSGYPFPAKVDVDDSAAAKAALRATRDALAGAERVLLLGAGPCGLELAGEITAMWPGKAVTIVDPAGDVVTGGYPDEFRAELRAQLDAMGVELLLGTSLREEPPTTPGRAETFTAVTGSGRKVTADIWFRCYGVVPNSGYLAGGLAGARRPDGQVEVGPDLRLPGRPRTFAVGDLAALPEAKRAGAAGRHAEVVAHNIRALIAGGDPVATYTPAPPGIALPLGPSGGVSYWADGGVLGAEETSEIKGAHLMTGHFRDLFGLS